MSTMVMLSLVLSTPRKIEPKIILPLVICYLLVCVLTCLFRFEPIILFGVSVNFYRDRPEDRI